MTAPFSHPDFTRNQKRVGNLTPCCVCGKGIKDMSKAKMLRVSTANEFVSPTVVLASGEDLGFYPIGPECLRNNPTLKEWAK